MNHNNAAQADRHLEPCPFCGRDLHAQWDRNNPKARCRTDGCKGSQLPVLNLDVPDDIVAWNTRAPLSKLRAPVADERAAFVALSDLVNALRERHYGRMPEEVQQAYDRAWTIVFTAPTAALASAPVAGEAVSWQVRRTDGSPLACWETCTKDLYDETLTTGRYNGLEGAPPCEVRALAVIDAAPQASEAVPTEPLRVFSAGTWTYDGTGQAFSHTELDEAAFVTYRDALSAQPGAQKEQSDEN